jgi:hypothetical protein
LGETILHRSLKEDPVVETLVCVPCGERIDHNIRQLHSCSLVVSGVCLRLHGSDEERKSLRQKENVAEAIGSNLKSSRSARASDRLKEAIFVAAPSNDGKIFREMNKELPRARASRKIATTVAVIRNPPKGLQRPIAGDS